MTCFNGITVFAQSVRRLLLPACAGIALLAGGPVEARGTGAGEARIAQCIRQAAGGRPWLEKTLWGLRDQEAGWIGAEVRNTNGSHDLGPMQVNSAWAPRIAVLVGRSPVEVRSWLVSDPCFNANAARWLFLTALRTTGDFWKAVGVYHSPTAWRQRRYALRVAGHMQRRFGQDIFATPLVPKYPPTAVDGNADTVSDTSAPSVTLHGFGTVRGPSS